jgi:hypothetical protein
MKDILVAITLTWSCALSVSGQIVINEIRASDSAVELLNTGGSTVNISTYWLCRFPNYSQLSSLTGICGDLNLAPGGLVTVDLNYVLNPTDDELGLYTAADFENPGAIVDYVEWGSSGHTRSTVAVAALIWTDGDFVPSWNECASLEYDGSGDSSGDWNAQDEPSMPCLANSLDGCSAMMPMELLAFNARLSTSGVDITWEAIHDPTATIVSLEHSLDLDKWSEVTTWIPSGPEFDRGVFSHRALNPGIQYYRLLISYMDGAYDYSAIETAKVCDVVLVVVKPNPATDFIEVYVNDESLTGEVEVSLSDIQGRVLARALCTTSVQFNLSEFPRGIYLVRIPETGVAERVIRH